MANPITKEGWRSGERLKSLAIRAAYERRPISGSREVKCTCTARLYAAKIGMKLTNISAAYPEGTRSDDGSMSSDVDTKGHTGVRSASTTRSGSSGESTIISAHGPDRSVPRACYPGQWGYIDPTIACIYSGCASNLTRRAWIQHVHTHIIAENPTVEPYGCPCDREPSWHHLLAHEADHILERGDFSSNLLKQLIIDAHGVRAGSKIPTGYRILHSEEKTKERSIAGGSSVPHTLSKSSQPTLLAVSSIPAPLPSEFTPNELSDGGESDCGEIDSDDRSDCNDLAFDGGESPRCDQSGGDSMGTVCSNTSTPTPRLSASEHSDDDESYSSEFDSGGSPGCDSSGEDGVIVHSNNTENGGERKRRRPNKTTGTRRPNPQYSERDSLSDGEEGEDDGDGEGDRPQNPKSGNQGPDFYGCPYYSREPEKYRKCASCRFPSHRVRDVKYVLWWA